MDITTNQPKNVTSVFLSEELKNTKTNYLDLGFDIIPIMAGEKAPPLIKGWQHINPKDIWIGTPENANIAIRCGGKKNLAVIDCDEAKTPGTFDQITEYLFCEGFDLKKLPIIKTASGIGRHIYLSVAVPLPGDYILLNPDFGSGEFRYGPGAYVLAPPSVVNGESYQIVSGDFSKVPVCKFENIERILRNPRDKLKLPILTNIAPPTIGTSNKHMSEKARRILLGDDKIISTFPSRSEADCSLMVSLINNNYSKEDIFKLFHENPTSGKFLELTKNNENSARAYLQKTYESAFSWTKSNMSEGRKIALIAKHWALHRPWPGRSGVYDRAVFLAHCEIAYQCGRREYCASGRQLAELVPTITDTTAGRATKRLIKSGLLTCVREHTLESGPCYKINMKDYALYQRVTANVAIVATVAEECIVFPNHEVFSIQALGLSSKQILDSLIHGSKTVAELANDTGRNVDTIRNCLNRMSRIIDHKTGEIYTLVIKKDGKWSINEPYDLDELAYHLGVLGKHKRRIDDFKEQRRLHRKALKLEEKLEA